MQKEQDYASKAFDNVAKNYDEIEFFKISARYVVEMIQEHSLKPNLQILDVACGTGNVVLECASCMSGATFDAVDISESMLEKAKVNAYLRELENITFHMQDITKFTIAKQYDIVTCSYALFFLPNTADVLKKLTQLLKPNGVVIFTSFLNNAFSPSNEILIPLLKEHGSPSAQEYEINKWENLKFKKDIEYLCTLAMTNSVEIQSKEIRYGFSLDNWWKLLNNTGYKGMLMELDEESYLMLKEQYYKEMSIYADENLQVELIADSYFVKVN